MGVNVGQSKAGLGEAGPCPGFCRGEGCSPVSTNAALGRRSREMPREEDAAVKASPSCCRIPGVAAGAMPEGSAIWEQERALCPRREGGSSAALARPLGGDGAAVAGSGSRSAA